MALRRDHDSSVFETTIRVLGGLMAAHDLTGDAMYVTRCVHGQRLHSVLQARQAGIWRVSRHGSVCSFCHTGQAARVHWAGTSSF